MHVNAGWKYPSEQFANARGFLSGCKILPDGKPVWGRNKMFVCLLEYSVTIRGHVEFYVAGENDRDLIRRKWVWGTKCGRRGAHTTKKRNENIWEDSDEPGNVIYKLISSDMCQFQLMFKIEVIMLIKLTYRILHISNNRRMLYGALQWNYCFFFFSKYQATWNKWQTTGLWESRQMVDENKFRVKLLKVNISNLLTL